MRSGLDKTTSPLTATILLTFLGVLIVTGVNLLDPMVRHDDFPALLAEPTGYYTKTLYEGRWINYLWHLRGVVTPSWLNYLIYQLSWAIYASCVAHLALGVRGPLWHRVALALLITLGPPALLISLWFNTLVPGLGLVALYAWLCTQLSERASRRLLLVFVPLTLMTYTTYPLFLLVICLVRADTQRSFRDLVGLLALFVASFALGMIAIFTLNQFAHGVFGVPMAPWRNGTPAHDLASALENTRALGVFFYETARVAGFGSMPLAWANLAMLAVASVFVGREDPWRVLYALSALVVGLGLVFVQTVKSGITLPVRVNGFSWAIYAVLLTLMVAQLSRQGGLPERLCRNLLLFVVLAYMAGSIKQYIIYRAWQGQTWDIAQQIGSGPEPLLVTGTYKSLVEADRAGIQKPRGLRLRLTYLTGRTVFTCEEKPERCAALPPEVLADLSPGETAIARHDGQVILRLSSQEVSTRNR